MARDKARFAQGQLARVAKAGALSDSKALYQALRPLRPASKRLLKPWSDLSVVPLEEGRALSFCDSQDAVASFFGSIEAGVPATRQEIPAAASRPCRLASTFRLDDLPTLLQVECLTRGVPACKAPGSSGIPNYVWGRSPVITAHHLHPLFVKSHMRLSEPVQFKDVSLVTLFKGKGAPGNLANHRAICLLETPGKILRKQLRPALLHALPASDLHQGGVPGSLLQAGQHVVRTYQAACRASRWPHAAYFLDVTAAYYRVIRCAFTELGETDEAVCAILRRLKVPPVYLQQVQAWATGACLLKDVSPHVRAFVAQTLHGTHFRVRGGSFITQTHAGVRPGDALADALFAFLQADFLRALEEVLVQSGFYEDDLFRNTAIGSKLIAPTWADDTVPLLSAPSCARLLEKLCLLGAQVHQLLQERGMQPNYDKGKTEIVATLIGPQAHACRHDLFIAHACRLTFTAPEGVIAVRCVPSYTHLGGRVCTRGGVLPDILQKSAAALAAVAPLRRSVFRCPFLALAVKRQIMASLAISRLSFSAPTWGRLNISETEAWRKAWTRLIRFLVPDDRWTGHPTLPGTLEVCRAAGVVQPGPFLRSERLLHYVRLVGSFQETLHAMLLHERRISDDSWLHLLEEDLRWAAALVDLPQSAVKDFPDGLTQFALDSPTRASRLFRLAAARAEHEATACSVDQDRGLFRCEHCAAQFTSEQRLSVHRFAVHGLRSAADSVASGTHCPCCMRQYWTRARLVRHLQHNSPICLQLLLEHGLQPAPLSEEERKHIAAMGKDLAHLPACRLCGPLLPLAHRTMGDVLADAQELLAACSSPLEVEAAAPAFCASFFPSPSIIDAIEGLCEALGSPSRPFSLPCEAAVSIV